MSFSVRVFLIGLLVCAQTVHAQPLAAELRVRIESNTGLPLSGSLVALVNAADSVAAEGVTRVDGRRMLMAPPGNYRVRVRRIGYRPFVSGDVALPPANADELILRVETERVVLNTMVVTATYQCGAISPDAAALSDVWDEIAKA
ncbi:MAG TPA: carboxypeptidase-like regulatory domain-containing protein, partial [Gemmatimonadaceae bacterium]